MIQLGNVDAQKANTVQAASTRTCFANPSKSYFYFILLDQTPLYAVCIVEKII